MAWAAVLATAAALAACDQGTQHDQPTQGPAVHVVNANIGADKALPADGAIQIALDRLLLPGEALRQSFILADANNVALEPLVTYDPVRMVVTLSNPNVGSAEWLTPGQPYKVIMQVPTSYANTSVGLRAFDGATLESAQQIGFLANAPLGAGSTQTESFCGDVLPIFQARCSSGECHGSPAQTTPSERFPNGLTAPAAGLVLDSSTGVAKTAIGRVAQGSNTGAVAGNPSDHGFKFGIDMPIIAPGNPGGSWLIYKLLLAAPQDQSSETTLLSARDCNGAIVPFTKQPAYAFATSTPSDDERARLSNYVLGNQMPYPPEPGVDNRGANLTADELERIQVWIAQGAQVDDCSVCIPAQKN